MGIPACLWRRTGEIYKGNKEFASLVNVPIENLREVSTVLRRQDMSYLTASIGPFMYL